MSHDEMHERNKMTIVFVATRGQSSLMQRLLVLSVRKFLPETVKIWAITVPHAQGLSAETTDLFDEMGVEIREIPCPLFFRFAEPSLVKIDFLSSPQPEGAVLLLNPGCIFLRSVNNESSFVGTGEFRANASFKGNSIIEDFNDELVRFSSELYNSDIDKSTPYKLSVFNTGVVIYSGLGQLPNKWASICKRLLHEKIGGEKMRRHVAQVALSIASMDTECVARDLPKGWNLMTANSNEATLLQYFKITDMFRAPGCFPIIEELVKSADDIGLNALGELTLKDLRVIGRRGISKS